MRAFSIFLLTVILVFDVNADSTDTRLDTLFNQLAEPELSGDAYTVVNQTIRSKDLVLTIDTAVFYPYRAIEYYDAGPVIPGGYLVGDMNMYFRASPKIERDQTKRILDTDSIDVYCETAELYASPAILAPLLDSSARFTLKESKVDDYSRRARREHKPLVKDENLTFSFATLRGITSSASNFILINTDPDGGLPRLMYLFDPFARQQVRLSRHYWKPGIEFIESINRYAASATNDPTTLPGFDRSPLDAESYTTDVSIGEWGEFAATSSIAYVGQTDGQQLLDFYVHAEAIIDSIIDGNGRQVEFVRWKDRDNRNSALYFRANEPVSYGDSSSFTFWYHGKVVELHGGHFLVGAGGLWYPQPNNYRDIATFDMTFRTHPLHTIVASGVLIDSSRVEDTIITHWRTTEPEVHVSFNIGFLEKYTFTEDTPIPIDVYIEEEFQKYMRSGRNMQKAIALDVGASLTLFTRLFGPCEADRIAASQIIATHGQSFPGFVHLGFPTWYSTSHWGDDELFRSHEVAHQWWGGGVYPASYHDTWLSEGFAEYCSMMYYQAVKGDEWFFERVKRTINDLYRDRKEMPFEGDSPGPIALAWRNMSVDDPGAYNRIVYLKGAMVLHMIRFLMRDLATQSDMPFFDMLRDWYQLKKRSYVTTDDFRRHVEQYAGVDLEWFFKQWVYDTYMPEYKFEYDIEESPEGGYTTNCRIETKNVPEDFKMYLLLEIDLGDRGKAVQRVLVDEPLREFSLHNLPAEPEEVTLDPFHAVLAKVKQ